MQNYRKQLDEIDQNLKVLIIKRLEIVKAIGLYKKANNLKVEDLKRESEIVENLISNLNDLQLKKYYKQFLLSIFEISKSLQTEIIND